VVLERRGCAMADDSHETDPKPANSGLDFDQIKTGIDNLDAEIREDSARRFADQAVIKKLIYDQLRLSEIVRQLRRRVSAEISSDDLVAVRRLCLSVYENLEEVFAGSSSLWKFDRRVGGEIEDSCEQAIETVSTFSAMLSHYESFPRDRSLSSMAADLEALSSARRRMIDDLRRFDEQLGMLIKRLDAASRSRGRSA
jgi:hypothetical protein